MRISDWSSDVCSSDLVAVGIATAIIPVYIAEIAPARDRGAHSGLFQIMIMIGVLASSIVALALTPYGAWRWMFGLGLLPALVMRSEEHTSELQSLMRISYAVFCLKKKKTNRTTSTQIRI